MNSQTLSILVVASEASPLARSGGLAEVTGSLPQALKKAGHQVAVCIPAYRRVLESETVFKKVYTVPVKVGNLHLSADILMGEMEDGLLVFLVRRDEYFERSGLYEGDQGEYFDNPERFVFFCRAVVAMCPTLGFIPDVILANDWQGGLIMPLLDLGALPRTAGVFAVHNQGYLGLVPPERTVNIGLPDRYYSMTGLEYFGQMSLLKAGIVYANAVTTVSPTYAVEVQTPEGGHGLDGVMRSVNQKLFGILNGVDYQVWNPASDAYLPAHFTPEDLSGKAICKRRLLEKVGLADLQDKPILGMVTRLTAQKGLNLLAETAEEILKMDTGLVILGSGDSYHEELARQLRDRYPERISLTVGYDVAMSHEIIAGSDMFLMPSLYEPCGLAQMFSLKYGTIPIVRATGGLNDTIKDPNGVNGPGTGFKFEAFQSRAMIRAVKRALEAYGDRDQWAAIMQTAMAEDFSWDRSAEEYHNVFLKAVDDRRKGRE